MGRPAFVHAAVAGALVALVFAAFGPALGHGFVNWDDPIIVTGNPHYRGLSGEHLRWMFTSFYGGHYEPFTWVSLEEDYGDISIHHTIDWKIGICRTKESTCLTTKVFHIPINRLLGAGSGKMNMIIGCCETLCGKKQIESCEY